MQPSDLLQAALSDLPAFLAAVTALVVFMFAAQRAYAKGRLPATSTRPLVHSVAGLLVAASPWLFHSAFWIYVTAGFFTVFNLVAVQRGWLPSLHHAGWSRWGTVTFPLTALLALLFTWGPSRSTVYVFQAAFVVLAICDPLATFAGRRWFRSRQPYRWINGKTVLGSTVFFVSATVLIMIVMMTLAPDRFSVGQKILLVLTTASLATAAEGVGKKGWDNLLIVAAVVLTMYVAHVEPESLVRITDAVLLSIVFCGVAVGFTFLRMDGAVAAGLLGVSLLGFGGWEWAMPPIVFFLGSSLVSRFGHTRKQAARFYSSKGSRRDSGQVLANGGVGWILSVVAIVFPSELLYWAFVGSFAGAAADTWATEIGTLVRGTTRSITTWRRVEPGESGGVSFAGTVAACAGAASVWAVIWFMGWTVSIGAFASLVLVIAGGFLGSLVDSVIGATVQALYRDSQTGRLTERPARAGEANELVRGFPWINNDLVNVIGCTIAAAVAAALYVVLTTNSAV